MKAHARNIIESPLEAALSNGSRFHDQDYVDEARDLMRKSRGREFPGTVNPIIIGELFTEQCQPWREIAMVTKHTILQAVYRIMRADPRVDRFFSGILMIAHCTSNRLL